jgi:tetratricopeptide (TPR) repeat protein
MGFFGAGQHVKKNDQAKLREQIEALTLDSLYLQFLRDQTRSALEADRLDETKALLTRFLQVRRVSARSAEKRSINTAAAEASLGWIALIERDYKLAAEHFHNADRTLPLEESMRRRDYQYAEAEAFYRLGREGGNNEALQRAIKLRRALLRRTPRMQMPSHWRMLQDDIGNALLLFGERQKHRTSLKKAIAAFRLALTEGLREQRPLDWATTQTKIGVALTRLGESEGNAARLRDAVVAFRLALLECTQERLPITWAMTQTHLGLALSSLAEHETVTTRLEEAVLAFRAALNERTRDRVPLDWARTQYNLGLALSALGERLSSAALLEEAAEAFCATLKERSLERNPLDWAATRIGLGHVLVSLGTREGGVTRLREGIEIYRDVLGVLSEHEAAQQRKAVKARLAEAEHTLAVREGPGFAPSLNGDRAQDCRRPLPASRTA